MPSIAKAVAAKLEAQRGNKEAAALWKKLWAAYEKRGPEGVQELLESLLDPPDADVGDDGGDP